MAPPAVTLTFHLFTPNLINLSNQNVTTVRRNFSHCFFWDMVFTRITGCTDLLTHRQTETNTVWLGHCSRGRRNANKNQKSRPKHECKSTVPSWAVRTAHISVAHNCNCCTTVVTIFLSSYAPDNLIVQTLLRCLEVFMWLKTATTLQLRYNAPR